MSEIRLLPSDPDYKVFDELWGLYAIAYNPACVFNHPPEDVADVPFMDVSEIEMFDILDTLEGWMRDLLDGLPTLFLLGRLKYAKGGQ